MKTTIINTPLNLAHTPTPIHRLNRISDKWNGDLWIKRDDMTGSVLTGNKVRKLEYLLADAQAEKADTIITCGGIQSNHCRATAFACAQIGFKCILILRSSSPAEMEGNLLLNHLAGAELHFVSNEQYYSDLTGIFNKLATEVKSNGGKAYVIPEGGSNGIGAWGYVEALREIRKQCYDLRLKPNRIVCATGSGGTHAGLLAGALLENWDVEIVSVSVCYDKDETAGIILGIVNSMIDKFNLNICVSKSMIKVIDGYIGEGYAKANKDVLDVIKEVAQNEGIVVDPVYTGKAVLGLKSELLKGELEGTTLFLHTGGVFGLFSFREKLAS
ncbi:MAG: D-cysteine desulfhydrase family protein [Candidatus Hatepunaea meridiana]|nr:D-cysteine desulfhydrase family protein [Candidatus Hatepunaea meridiana]